MFDTVDTFPYIFPIPHVYGEMNVRIGKGKGAELLGYKNSKLYKNLVSKFSKKYKQDKAEQLSTHVFHLKQS